VPKAKTHKGTAKRFKVTAGGKVMAQKAGRRHNLEKKPTSRKRRLRNEAVLGRGDSKHVLKLLPYA